MSLRPKLSQDINPCQKCWTDRRCDFEEKYESQYVAIAKFLLEIKGDFWREGETDKREILLDRLDEAWDEEKEDEFKEV